MFRSSAAVAALALASNVGLVAADSVSRFTLRASMQVTTLVLSSPVKNWWQTMQLEFKLLIEPLRCRDARL